MPSTSVFKNFLLLFFVHLQINAQEYRPNEVLRGEIRNEKWNEFKLKTPKKHKLMSGLIFKTNQCFDLYTKVAMKLGYPVNEVTTMLTFYNVILKENARGRDYSKAEIDNEYEVTRKSYLKSSKENNWSSRQLQSKYDRLLLDAIWIAVLNEFSKGHTTETKALASELLVKEEEVLSMKENPNESSKTETLGKSKKPLNATNLKVEDIILRTVTNYGMNGVYIDNEVSILFTNGEILTNPTEALDELNIELSKKKYPKRWNTWTKKNNIIYVTKSWKGKTYDWKKWFKVRPANKGQKLTGKFNTSDPFGGATVINASTVSFDKQGRFVWKTIKGGDTSWKPMYSKSNEAGTYRIEDFRIVLHYNNGKKESFFFGFYPKDNEHFVIGSSHFVPVE